MGFGTKKEDSVYLLSKKDDEFSFQEKRNIALFIAGTCVFYLIVFILFFSLLLLPVFTTPKSI